MKRGLFIVFEGGDGAGKSTQINLLVDKVRSTGLPVVVTREPGGTRIGEQIRAITHSTENLDLDPVAEAYLMAASRAQHVREVIAPALDSGKIVLCDRFVDSSIAYQGYGRQLGEEVVARLNELAVDGAEPDIVILLDLDPRIGQGRLDRKGNVRDRLDLQHKDFYERVRNGFLALAKKFPNRYVVVSATAGIDDVAFAIWKQIEKRINDTKGE